jgi:hypothetical protein
MHRCIARSLASQQSQFANGPREARISRLLSLALTPYSMATQVVPEQQQLLEKGRFMLACSSALAKSRCVENAE